MKLTRKSAAAFRREHYGQRSILIAQATFRVELSFEVIDRGHRPSSPGFRLPLAPFLLPRLYQGRPGPGIPTPDSSRPGIRDIGVEISVSAFTPPFWRHPKPMKMGHAS